MDEQTSVFVAKEPCPECGSRDNLARYSDGHAHCFGCEYYEPGDAEAEPPKRKRQPMSDDLLPKGKIAAIKTRSLSVETCRKYGYTVSKMRGEFVQVAPYYDRDGDLVAQHIRTTDKDFPWIGDKSKKLKLFGQQAMRDDAYKVIVTEGELDAMSVWQAINQGKTRWAAVSIMSGAKNAKADIAANLQWLEQAEEVILMFDMDEVGQDAAKECARLFKPGKVKIAKLPLKDANEMLMAGKAAGIVDAIYEAQAYRPDGIVKIADVLDDVMTDPVMGLSWWVDSLNEDCYGRQYGELVGIGAGTGVGKTDFLTQQLKHDIVDLDLKVAIFFLEQQPSETVRRLAGKFAGKRFHIPSDKCDPPWTTDDLRESIEALDKNQNLFMYDHFGVADYDRIEEMIRFLYHSEGIRVFYVDHLTALAAQAVNEKDELERIMSMMGGLVKEIPIWLCYISHLTTPDGKPHEEGGRVMIRHFKGSRSIGFWTHRMYGLERNQQAEDIDEQTTTTLRTLKDRPVGTANGKTYALGYEESTGLLYEKSIGGSAFGPVNTGDIF